MSDKIKDIRKYLDICSLVHKLEGAIEWAEGIRQIYPKWEIHFTAKASGSSVELDLARNDDFFKTEVLIFLKSIRLKILKDIHNREQELGIANGRTSSDKIVTR